MNGSLAILPLLAVLVALAYKRSKPPGYQVTLRDFVILTLTIGAIGSVGIGTAVVFSFKFEPEVTLFDRVVRGLIVGATSLAPFALILLFMLILRTVRKWEDSYQSRHRSDRKFS